jgi:Protein of unknown function (DUF2442)
MYLKDYQIRVKFSDQTERDIDFEKPFNQLKGYYANYREPALFQTFTIEMGNLVWGKNWDVIFPVWDLYTDRFK